MTSRSRNLSREKTKTSGSEPAYSAGNIKVLNGVFIAIAACVLAGGVYLFMSARPTPAKGTQQIATPTPELAIQVPQAAPPPPIPTRAPTPVPTPSLAPTPTPLPLPNLNNSDADVTSALTRHNADVAPLIAKEELIRKFVRATYSAHQGRIVQQYRPVTGPNTAFVADKTGDTVTIKTPKGDTEIATFTPNGKTFGRYSVYVDTLNRLPAKTLKALYTHYYPLLQRAYSELGEGPDQFHTVMLKALELMINTPNITDDYTLIQTSVMYTFQDKQLESLPAAQKLLLRMGKHNREKLINNLKGFRNEIISFSP